MKLLEWREFSPKGNGEPKIPTSLTRRERNELARLAKGCVVAEIGTAFGFSAIAMALGGAKRVVTADPHEWFPAIHGQNTYLACREYAAAWKVDDRVEFRTGRGEDVLIENGYDGCFIDGDHSPLQVPKDLAQAEQLVKPGGWIAVHDFDEESNPFVRPAVMVHWPASPYTVVDTLYVHG